MVSFEENSSFTPQNITFKSDILKKYQLIHALAINIIPLIGTLIAIVVAIQDSVALLDIELLISFYILTMIGITVGYHRCFAHNTFKTNTAINVILIILGSMAAQGPLIYWVSNHRRHHQYSDRNGDPHSPYIKDGKSLNQLQGLYHAQIGWTYSHEMTNTVLFAKDLIRDSIISKINKLYYLWVLLGLLIPPLLGLIITGTLKGAITAFLWGSCIRLFVSIHITNSINSITHLYGTRPFNTKEKSTNNIWLALPTLGEAWHNNHHAFPNSAKFGLFWWQLDLGYYCIRFLELIGLAWNVKSPTQKMIEAKKINLANIILSKY